MSIGRVAATALALTFIGLICLFYNLSVGSFDASFMEIANYLLFPDDSTAAFTVTELRLPRALAALLVGMALALSGTLIQTISGNPLGDPGLTGVTSGAAFGVALAISFVTVAQGPIIAAGIVGGVTAAALTLLLSRRSLFDPVQLVLSGVAVSILFIALTSAVMIYDRASTQTLYFWLIGGFVNRTWLEVAYLWPWVAASGLLALVSTRMLDILTLDDTVARTLGVPTSFWRLYFLVLSVTLAAVSVAIAGPIGFVGFLAPHLARSLLGAASSSRHCILLPVATLCGSLLTLVADTGSRALPFIEGMPAGALIAVIGGTVFLLFARRAIRAAA